MTFSVRFDPCSTPDGEYRRGAIALGDWSEGIRAHLRDWTDAEYEQHWRLTAAQATAAQYLVFATSLSRADGADLWIMRRDQDRFIVLNKHARPRTTKLQGLLVDHRGLVAEKDFVDDRLSRWFVPVSAVTAFSNSAQD